MSLDRPLPQLLREVTDPCELLRAVRSARTADHEQDRVRVAQLREAADREAHALQRLDTSGEQQHAPTVEAEPILGDPGIGGEEHRVVDAGRHNLDPFGHGAVTRRELFALRIGRREHEIRTCDHLVLDAGPFVGVVVDTSISFDARKGVERRDHRRGADLPRRGA